MKTVHTISCTNRSELQAATKYMLASILPSDASGAVDYKSAEVEDYFANGNTMTVELIQRGDDARPMRYTHGIKLAVFTKDGIQVGGSILSFTTFDQYFFNIEEPKIEVPIENILTEFYFAAGNVAEQGGDVRAYMPIHDELVRCTQVDDNMKQLVHVYETRSGFEVEGDRTAYIWSGLSPRLLKYEIVVKTLAKLFGEDTVMEVMHFLKLPV